VLFGLLELAWELQRIDQVVFGASPFAHVHWILQPSAAPVLALTAVAAGLTGVGLLALRRGDVG